MSGGWTIEQDLVVSGDLSVTRRTAWFDLQGGAVFSLDMGCAAGVAGVVSIEACNHGQVGVPGAAIPEALLPGLTQPDGGVSPWACVIDFVETVAKYVALVWTPTSGGAGNYLTNSAQQVGTGPRIVVKGRSLSATVVSAVALDLRTVRVTFSDFVDITALDPSVWAFTGTSAPPFATPTVTLTDGVDSGTAPTSVDLGLSFDLTPGATYVVTSVGVTGVSAPSNFAAFDVPALPVVAGRSFSFLRWIPEMNLREDDTQDLRNFLAVADETLRLLLNDVDQWGEIQDPDLAPEPFVDRMLTDFGNPVEDAALSTEKKRVWMKSLIDLYKQIGTLAGLRNAVYFFLGFEINAVVFNRQGMRLGQSLMGLDWILGTGDWLCHLLIKVATTEGRTFTDYEERVLRQIIKMMACAHEEITIQAVLPAPTAVAAAASGTPDGIEVSWGAVSGATSYAVYMRAIPDVTVLNAHRTAVPTGTSVVLEMLPDGHRYFVVVAINAQGEGLASVEVDAISG